MAMKKTSAAAAAAAFLCCLSAAASATSVDEQPLAPELNGLGTLEMPVSTAVPGAQRFFNQGVRLLYAFNHQEAQRAFDEAARLDPKLAMAYWGRAMTLAPNINAPMTPENARLAYEAVQAARRTSAGASARERALINALAARFAADPAAPRAELDRAYARAMAAAAAAYPNDPDIQTFYADAVMNTMAWDYWLKDGSLKPEALQIRDALQGVIARFPDHPGANHYYIHLLEGSNTPEAAEASADRLGSMMPAAGHMVHMPAHIYLRVGRYADASEANVRAIAADEDYLAQCQAQGLYPISYYPHNLHFLWAASTLEGRSAVALASARQVAAKVPHHKAGALSWTVDFPETPWLAYVRFGRWQDMLTEPQPPATEPYATGIWHYGRALAFIARNQIARADAERAALADTMKHEAFRTTLKDLPLLTNLRIADRIVGGELAAREGRTDDAVRLLEEAVALEDGLPYNEPPVWHQPTRQVLGAVLLEIGRPAEAEAAYRKDLTRFRENGWSLFGLWKSLEAQGRNEDAARARARFEKAWARADFTLTSSRVLSDASRPPAPSSIGVEREDFAERSVALSTGVTLRYVEHGPTSGVPVILLHGVTDSWRSFEPVLRRLPTTVRAFAITQRGHGDSDRPDSGYRYVDMSDDLGAFMDAMRLPSAVIVGHSMGSMVAQRFAIDHPDRVAGLVLAGAFATLQDHPAITDFVNTTIAGITDPIDRQMVREFQTSTLARAIPPAMLDTAVNESLKVPARVWRQTFRGFLDTPDFSDELGAVSAPTLIVWGDRDSYATRSDQDRLIDALPHARLLTYEGTGHALHWEDPDRFASDLAEFVAALQ